MLALPFCAVALLWDKLPGRLPVHWNIDGEIDGYAGKAFAALCVPVSNVLAVALIGVVVLIDPRMRRQPPETRASSLKAIKAVRLVVSFFLTAVSLTMLGIGAGLSLDLPRIVGAGLALLFLVFGNVMGKLRPNYFVGIRTPWTLEDPEVWLKTLRLAGKLMVVGSLVLLAGCLVLPPAAYIYLCLPAIGVMALVPVVYSFVLYKKQHSI